MNWWEIFLVKICASGYKCLTFSAADRRSILLIQHHISFLKQVLKDQYRDYVLYLYYEQIVQKVSKLISFLQSCFLKIDGKFVGS